MFNIINKSPLLLLILLIPLFFTSVPLAAMKAGKRLATDDRTKIKRQKIQLTQEQQNKINNDLYIAITNNNLKNVVKALKAGADITTKIKTDQLTLELPIETAALCCCSPDIFKALFFHGANPQLQKPLRYKQSLLHMVFSIASSKPHFVETLRTLLQYKVSLHSADFRNDTPLLLATKAYQECIPYNWKVQMLMFYHAIELLLFAGADHEKQNDENQTPLDLIDPNHQAPIERLINIASFFSQFQPLRQYLPDLLLSHISIPDITTLITNYLNPLRPGEENAPSPKEHALWDELTPIRHIQQELLIAPLNGLPEEEEEKQ